MNFLAHLYLSGENAEIQIGNFIGDSVKGLPEIGAFTPGILYGIQMHRFIDTFTDHHPMVKALLPTFKPTFGRYAGVVVDIYYDHFLALHWSNYHKLPLTTYTANVYSILELHSDLLPERVKEFLPYMLRADWLSNYANFEGLQKVFNGMMKRANFASNMDQAVHVLKEHYTETEDSFNLFFPELIAGVEEWKTQHPML
jgi:acyl carrier protein phosphodiesterase